MGVFGDQDPGLRLFPSMSLSFQVCEMGSTTVLPRVLRIKGSDVQGIKC